MRVLFVSANSARAYVDIEREHRLLQRLLETAGHSLRWLPGAEPADLRDALCSSHRRGRFDALHFSGHATREDGLLLRGEDRRNAPVSADRLAEMLDGAGLGLVMLNACHSDRAAATIGTLVPAAIGTKHPLRDAVARRFAEDFYGALTRHATVRQAFDRALGLRRKGTAPYMLAGTHPDIVLSSPTARPFSSATGAGSDLYGHSLRG